MPDSEVSVKFSTKGEADLYKAIVGIATEMNKAVSAGDRAANSLGKIDPELRRFAGSIKQISTTPLDRLDEKLTKLHKAFSAGLIGKAELAAGYKLFQADFDASSLKQLTDEEKRAAAEAVKAAAETEKFAESVKKITSTHVDRLNEKLSRLQAALKAGHIDQKQFDSAKGQFQTDFARESISGAVRAHSVLRSENKKTGDSAKALGIINTQTWASMVTAVSTASQTIGSVARATFQQVKQALQDIRQEADNAARNMGESLKSQGSLAQLGATPEENKRLTQMADAAFLTGSVESRLQGADLVKSLSNANKLNELPLFGRMQRTGLVGDAGKFAGMLNTIQTSMGADAGNSEQLASMVVQAGTKSYDDVNALVAGAAKAGAAAKGAGGKTSELLAGTAILSQALGGSDLGGERMKAFYESIERNPRLRGETLADTLENIQKRTGGRTDKAAKMLGSSEAMGAFQVLYQNRADLSQQIGDIETARDKNYALKKMDWLESDPARQAEIHRRASAARADMEKERTLGQPAALAQAAIDQEAANARLGKVTGFQSGFARGLLEKLGVPLNTDVGREFHGYATRKVGNIQREWLGDRQLISQRANIELPEDSPERQKIMGSLKATESELLRQQSGESQFEAGKIMGVREEGPLFRQRSQQRAERDEAAAAQLRAAETQASAARDMKQVSGQMVEFGRMFANQQNIIPTTVAPDTSRRAQFQHAIPAE